MSEHEPRSLPWYEDEIGHYIRIRTESGAYDLRPEDTDIYLHDEPYGQIDHLFHELYSNEDEVSMGFRVWRDTIDNVLGEGAFDMLVEDMRARNFFIIHADKPTEQDMDFWEGDFGKFEPPIESIERIGDLALKNYDAEFEYYLGEGGEWVV